MINPEDHLKLAWKVANEMDKKLFIYEKRRGIDVEDLFQVASMGLVKAARTYKEEKGIKFSTYAVCRMRYEIINYVHKTAAL